MYTVFAKGFLYFIIILLLGSCDNSSGSRFPDLPSLPDGITESNSNDWDRIMTDSGYVLNANPWNKQATSRPYHQTIFKGVTGDGEAFFGWRWYWDVDGYTVLAYPQVFCGYSPFGPVGEIGHMTGYPYVIGGHSFYSSFDVSITTHPVNGEEYWNLVYDIWVLDSSCDPADFDSSDIKSEIMIWVDRQNLSPSVFGDLSDNLSVNGSTFDYYYNSVWPDGHGPDGTHSVNVFCSRNPVHIHDNFDLTPFLTYLVNAGVITNNDYIATVEFGTEVARGTGRIIFYDYSVTVSN